MKKSKIYKIIVFCMGAFATMPIVTIPFGNSDISIFRMIFYLILIYMVIKTAGEPKIRIIHDMKLFYIWLGIACVSCCWGGIILRNSAPEFSKMAMSYLPKVVLYLLFAILWTNQKKLQEANICLVKGLFAGCILNLIWAILDAVGYYTIGISVNNLVFSGYSVRHNIRYNIVSLIYSNGMIRSGGFNYDPAHLGYIIPVIAGYAWYKKKWGLILLAIGGVLASASTTSLVSSVCVILLISMKNNQIKLKKVKQKEFMLAIATLIALGVLMISYGQQLSSIISTSGSKMLSRVTNTYLNSGNADVRWSYLKYVPRVLMNLGVNSILGLGFGNASYGYTIDNSILSDIGMENNFAYDVENTYICYLLDTGIIGFVFFIGLLFVMLRYYYIRYKKNSMNNYCLIIYSSILAMIVSMFFYHYILFTPQILIMIIALSMMEIEKRDVDCERINL